ncbi:MAG: toll/interleukin-1 receptor domain-containing protein [Nostoc sp. DedQUE12a]|nr:toll/interleukin-1 receptor domain-containing protein [Nostoc sp. DedQUE12a]
MNEAIEVFLSYAPEDEALLEELVKHLSILQRHKVIKAWYDRQISAGAETNAEIDEHFNTARIILLLISADFLRSDDCYTTVERAMKRHKAGEVRVIPIILRPVDYQGAVFTNLQPLPVDAKPVTQWTNLDAAFANVATGIRKVVEELASKNL